MFNIEKGVYSKHQWLKKTPFLGTFVIWSLKKILHEKDVINFIEENRSLPPLEFNLKTLEYFHCHNYTLLNKEIIPLKGRGVVIANHPLGALEALALLDFIGNIRKDIKIVANDLLMLIEPLRPLFLPVDAMTAKTAKEGIENIYKALNSEELVIIFPAGVVSRKKEKDGLKDGKWNRGFLRFAKKTKSPIIPIKIEAKNSWYFYALSKINEPISSLFLPDQMFRRKGKPMKLTIKEQIPYEEYSKKELKEQELVDEIKENLYK